MTLTLDDYFTYTLSFLWLILVIISLNQLFLEILRYRRLKKQHQQLQPPPSPPQFETPLHLRPTPLPTSHSISSLSHVYMENGILNVTFRNPRLVSVSSSDPDWNSPSAFIGRPPPQQYPMHRLSSSLGLTKHQINTIAPITTFVNQPNKEKLTCVICLEQVNQPQRIRQLPCTHSFHAKCILIWLQRANRCPCCAKHIIPRDTEQLPVETVERVEPRRFFGLSTTQLADRTDQTPRHHGLWSFSNRRANRAQWLRRGGFNGTRATTQSRGRNNRIPSNIEHIISTTAHGTRIPRSQSEHGHAGETSRFEEILDVDYDEADVNRASSAGSTSQ